MRKWRASAEKGQSLVELGIGFTFLLLLVGGVIDVGSMIYSYLALRDTAQEGVIYGSYHPTDTSGIIARVQSSAAYPIDASQLSSISVHCNGGSCSTTSINSCQGQKITVQVTFNYQFIMPLVGSLVGQQTFPLTASVTDTILMSSETVSALRALDPPVSCP